MAKSNEHNKEIVKKVQAKLMSKKTTKSDKSDKDKKSKPIEYQDNTKYIGDQKDGQPHGKGTITFAAASYEGEFMDGKAEGQGKF